MLQSIDTLLCAVPVGQPLCRERVISPQNNGKAMERHCHAKTKVFISKSFHDRRPDGLKIGSRDAVMVDMVLRPHGATRAEMKEALGWKSDPYPSMMGACDKAGVVVSVIRGEGQFRYKGLYQCSAKG